jgi:N-acyl-D-amino-acid deacylase
LHDLVIRNGTIVDGTGAPRFQADIAIDGGHITAVGQVGPEAATTIDATGRIVTPGFVDVHTTTMVRLLGTRPLHPPFCTVLPR